MQDSLHHEILLALSGYPGDAFRVSKETLTIEVGVCVEVQGRGFLLCVWCHSVGAVSG